jgi:mannose-6-phosphate isomerase-like protein (cupin superfamily)
MKPSVDDVGVDMLPVVRDSRGTLTIVEFSKIVPFQVARLFYISGVKAGLSRGGHAHYRCRQYLICQDGRLEIHMADGTRERSVELSSGQAVLVEPGIFAAQTYLDDNSAMLVLCDRPYESEDYIHGMDEFLKFRRGKA